MLNKLAAICSAKGYLHIIYFHTGISNVDRRAWNYCLWMYRDLEPSSRNAIIAISAIHLSLMLRVQYKLFRSCIIPKGIKVYTTLDKFLKTLDYSEARQLIPLLPRWVRDREQIADPEDNDKIMLISFRKNHSTNLGSLIVSEKKEIQKTVLSKGNDRYRQFREEDVTAKSHDVFGKHLFEFATSKDSEIPIVFRELVLYF